MSTTDAEAARLFLKRLIPEELEAKRGQAPPVAPVFAPGEQIRLKPGARIPVSPKGETNGPSSPHRGTQSTQGRNPAPPARVTPQARPSAARGNYTTSYIPVREKENGMNIPGSFKFAAAVAGLIVAILAVSWASNLAESGRNKVDAARIKIELDARERAAGIAMKEVAAAKAQAELKKREPVSSVATPFFQKETNSSCGEVIDISTTSTIAPGCAQIRIGFLVTNMYGNLTSMQTPFGSCSVVKECQPLINRMRGLPDNDRVITVMVPEGSFTFVN